MWIKDHHQAIKYCVTGFTSAPNYVGNTAQTVLLTVSTLAIVLTVCNICMCLFVRLSVRCYRLLSEYLCYVPQAFKTCLLCTNSSPSLKGSKPFHLKSPYQHSCQLLLHNQYPMYAECVWMYICTYALTGTRVINVSLIQKFPMDKIKKTLWVLVIAGAVCIYSSSLGQFTHH